MGGLKTMGHVSAGLLGLKGNATPREPDLLSAPDRRLPAAEVVRVLGGSHEEDRC